MYNIVLVMNAIETTGVVDAQHQLRLDEPLPIAGQSRVRVIELVPDEADTQLSRQGEGFCFIPLSVMPCA
jgi:hypothetical protein